MPEQLPEPWSPRRCAQEVLLHYVYLRGFDWPGADSLTAEEILRTYPAEAAAGRVPTRRELARRHPELAAEFERLIGD